MVLFLIGPPISFYPVFQSSSLTFYAAATTLLIFIALLQLTLFWESAIAISKGNRHRQNGVIKNTTVIISAYLDNEQNVLLNTLIKNSSSLLTQPTNEIILTYRSDNTLPIENQIDDFSRQTPNLRILKVTSGIGKSDQMNAALALAVNENIYFLDADAIVCVGDDRQEFSISDSEFCFSQGTNLIRDPNSLLAKIISVEYLVKYLVAQNSRYKAAGLTYFCGSNGMWVRSVARKHQFSSSSLVEDVEASLRADLAGNSGVFSPAMIATELAPNKIFDWWHQRRRWAHGWFEVGALHYKALLHGSLPVLKKFNWFYLIWLRRGVYATIYFWCFTYLSLIAVLGHSVNLNYVVLFFVAQWGLALVQVFAASYQASAIPEIQPDYISKLLYIFFFPAYDALKNLVTIAGWMAWIGGNREWRVTPRR